MTKKKKWKEIVNQKVMEEENKRYATSAEKLSKLRHLNIVKKEIKKEKYLELSRSEASVIFRLRTRMLPLKNNMNSSGDVSCPRCHTAPDTEIHLIEECGELKDLRTKFHVESYNEVFTTTNLSRLGAIVAFVRESLDLNF